MKLIICNVKSTYKIFFIVAIISVNRASHMEQYMNHELPDVQGGFRKGRGTRDQIANICWIIEKGREKNISFIDYAKAFD